VLREKGMTEELINAAIRVASVIHAIGVIVESEKAAPTPVALGA
jgi:alkyl hydroperoxide reductase subunit D